MNLPLRKTLLAVACVAALHAATAAAQTVTTPPRTLSSQQETQGVDSTFTGNVQPNAQTSTFQTTVTGSPPPPPPPPPTVTCTPGAFSKPVYQTASCPPGYLTTAGGSTFTQSAVDTISTTCPAGSYGAPSTSTATGAWSPTPAAVCTITQARQIAPLSGKTFSAAGVGYYVGGFMHGGGQVNVTFSNGSYQIVTYGNSTPGVVASGSWLPPGRSASDFTVAISASVYQLSNRPYSPAYPAPTAFPPTLVTWVNSQPTENTATTWRGVGINDPKVSVNGAGNIGVMAGGGQFFLAKSGSPISVYIAANITVTITDNRYGDSASTSFIIAGGD